MRNVLRKVVNYFAKKLHHGFPTEFYTHFIFIDTNLKLTFLNQFEESSYVNTNKIIL